MCYTFAPPRRDVPPPNYPPNGVDPRLSDDPQIPKRTNKNLRRGDPTVPGFSWLLVLSFVRFTFIGKGARFSLRTD